MRRSNVANAVPGSADLNEGELAINTMDGALYFKKSNGTIITGYDDTIMHIDSDDNRVGIGTASPNTPLHLQSSIDYVARFQSTDTTVGILLQDSNATNRITNTNGHLVLSADINGVAANSSIRFIVDSTSNNSADADMVLNSTGLGIGTSTPVFKLSVDSGTGDWPAHFKSTDNKAGIIIADDDTTAYFGAESSRAFMGIQAGIHVNNLNVMNTGYVGIGTTSPARRLTVQGSSGDNLPARFIGGANTTHGSIEFQDPTTTADYKVVIGSKTDDLYFQSGGNEKARLTSGGFLGIGTGTIADTPIHVYRASGITGIIPQLKLHANTSDNTGTQGSSIDFVASSDKTAVGSRIIAARVAAGAHQNLKFHTARDTFAMIIDENQNVGIGVADPSAKLQVDGAIVSEGGSFASAQEGSVTDVGLVVPKNNYIYSDDGTYLRRIIGTTSAGLIEIGQGGTALITDIILKPGSTGNVRVFASGSEDVRINSSGNMGVGTTNPIAKLVVSNSEAEGIEFFPGNFTNGNVIQNYNRATNAYVSLKQSAADYRFNIGTAEKARIDTLGRLLVTDNGYNAQFGNNIGGNSDKFVAVSSATAGQTVAYHLGVNDTARNSRVKLFMTDDAATANRAFGIAQTWSAGGAMPFILTMGNNERLKVSTTGTVTFNNAYTFPASIGTAGQILKVPATGTDLIWGADAGGGSATLLTDSDGDTLIQVEEGTDDDIIRFDVAGSEIAQMTDDGVVLNDGYNFEGDVIGAIKFKAQAGEALTKGDTVYISGISGNTTIVSKADANDAAKMPAFGLAASTVSLNAAVQIVTFGTLQGIDTSSYSEGDELYVNVLAGTLTDNAPTGSTSALQKIAKVTRSDASAGSVKVSGAGRTNATPNLDEGKIFVGNASNKSVQVDDTLHVDMANSRVGVNTTSPGRSLHVDGTVRIDGGTGVATTGVLEVMQNGDDYDSGISLTSSFTNSHRIWKNSSGVLNIGSSVSTTALQQAVNGDITLNAQIFKITGASPYIEGTGTGAMRIKHTAGQTMHIRPDQNGPVSFFEGNSGNHVYLMTATPTANSSTNDSSYLSFQTRSKKADGTSQSATASIRARTLNVSNNQSELLFTGMSQHRFTNDIVVEGNLTVNGTQTILNTATLSVDDLNITVADGAADAAAANGAGLTVDGANATWTYSSGDDAWASNKHAQFYTGGGTGTLSVGRTSDQALRLYADDNYNRIFAYQDADSNQDHFFDLVRSFAGTGRADMRFMSGSAVHAVLDKDGNFGINTAAPSNKLEVNGIGCMISGLRLGSSASGEGLIRHGGATSYGVGITTGALTSPNIKLFVAHANDGGGVGIGTTAPKSLLNVTGTGADGGILTLENDSTSLVTDRKVGQIHFYSNDGSTNGAGVKADIKAIAENTIGSEIGLAFGTSGTGSATAVEAMRIDASGKVGIGTSSPAERLEVSGGHIKITNTGNANLYINANNAGSDATIYFEEEDSVKAKIQHDASNDSMLFTDGAFADTMTLKGTRVGIRTTSPAEALHVDGGNIRINIPDTGSSPANTAEFQMFGYEGRGAGIRIRDSVNSASNASDREWFVGSGYATDGFGIGYASNGSQSSYLAQNKFLIKPNGNIGIGTYDPATKLQISNNGGHTSGNVAISHSSFDLYNPLEADTNEKGSIITFSDNYYDGTNYIRTTRAGIKGGTDTVGNTADGFLAFYTDSGGANSLIERMRIDKNGFVGIGDTTPEVHLDVRGTGDTWTKVNSGSNTAIVGIRLGTATNSRENVLYRNKSNNLLTLRSGIDNAELNFIVGGSSQEAMRINGSGNVGIGTDNPSNLLHVHATGNGSSALIIEDDARRLEMGRDMIQAKNANGSGIENLYIQPAGTTSFASNSGAVAIGNTGTLNGAKLYVKNGSSGQTYSNMSGILIDVNGNSNSYYGLRVGSSSGNNHLTVTNAGNVGIGTASVDAKLKVNQDAVATSLKVTGGNSGSNIAEFVRDVGGTATVSVSGYSANPQMHFASTSNTFAVGVRSNSFNIADHSYIDGTNIRLAIDNTGRVGIGVDAPLAKLQVEEYGIDTTTSSTTATTQVAIHSFPIANFRSARFTIQITNSTDSTYHSTEILAIHDGTTANITEFGEVHTGSSVEATFDADVSSGNFRLLATPTSTNSMAFKVVCHSLTV